MNHRSTQEPALARPQRPLRHDPARLGILLALLLAGFLAALALDGVVYRHVRWPREHTDLHNLFRLTGYLPTLIVLGAGLTLIERRHLPAAVHIVLCAAASGLAAELLKMLVGRERPETHHGEIYFKPFLHGFVDQSNLAFPSSHAAVSFGAAWMACLFFPRGRWLWLGLAAGCALSRIAAGAHWLSDCYAAAVVAFLAFLALRPLALPQLEREPQ